MAGYNYRRDMFASKAASGVTSETHLIGDATQLSLFISGSPSTTTIQGSNADGSSTDITNTTADWSDLSVVVAPSPDVVDIETGFRYLRCLRSETTSVILHAQMGV